jgi:serine/threonine protein kinase
MFECLAGRPPYNHPLESQVLQLHARAPVPEVRKVRADAPAALAEVVERALAKNADERWQSAEEMRQALLAAV